MARRLGRDDFLNWWGLGDAVAFARFNARESDGDSPKA
jgi:hypothetical protein